MISVAPPQSELLVRVLRRWARLGVMFGVAPAMPTPDLERLLCDSARVGPEDVSVLLMAGTWLRDYGQCVAKQRLAVLVSEELEADSRALMGLMLEWAAGVSQAGRFNRVLAVCRPMAEPCALTLLERRHEGLNILAERLSSELGRKWGLWISEESLVFKSDALRPAEWVAAENTGLRFRALCGGDLAASILAEWSVRFEAETSVLPSEAAIAARLRVTRKAVHEAIQTLRMAGLARVKPMGRTNRVELVGA